MVQGGGAGALTQKLGPSVGHLSAAVPLGGREPPAVPPPAAEGHDPHRDAAANQVPPAPAKHRAEHRYGPPLRWALFSRLPPWPGASSVRAWSSPGLVPPSPTEEPAEREKVELAAECCREILHHVNQAVRDMEDLLVSLVLPSRGHFR